MKESIKTQPLRLKLSTLVNSRSNQILLGILFLSVILRVAAAIYMGNQVVDLPGTADQLSYHSLAQRVIGGYGFSFGQDWWPATPANAPTAHWSFLYTFYLVIVYLIFGVHPVIARLIQAVLVGIFQPLFVYLIGRLVFSRTIALISAAIVAIYAYFIYYAGTLMTEPFYITAILATLYVAMLLVKGKERTRPRPGRREDYSLALLMGALLAAAVLLRQLFLLVIPFLFLWVLWAGWKSSKKNLLLPLVVAGLVIVAAILPFTIYNTICFGHFVLLNTNAGFAFFWGNNPVYGTHFRPLLPDYHVLIPKELLSLDEAALDSALMMRGFQYVLANPVSYILLSLSRIPVFFMFWPSSNSELISNISRVGSFGIFLPFMLYGLVRSFIGFAKTALEKRFHLLLLVGFAVIYTGIHLLTWALVRYRLPVDMVMTLFAGVAFADLGERVWKWIKARRNTLAAVSIPPVLHSTQK